MSPFSEDLENTRKYKRTIAAIVLRIQVRCRLAAGLAGRNWVGLSFNMSISLSMSCFLSRLMMEAMSVDRMIRSPSRDLSVALQPGSLLQSTIKF